MKISILIEFENLKAAIESLENSREKSLALTKLEECQMWLEKAIEKEEDVQNENN